MAGCPNCGGVVSANADSGCGCYITGKNGVKATPTTGGFVVEGDIKSEVRTDTAGPALQWDPASGCMILRPAVICAQCGGSGGDTFTASQQACNGLSLESDGWFVERRRYREHFGATNGDALPGSFPTPYTTGTAYRLTELTITNDDPCGRRAIADLTFQFDGYRVEMSDNELLDMRPQINLGNGWEQPSQYVSTDIDAKGAHSFHRTVYLNAGQSLSASMRWFVGATIGAPSLQNGVGVFANRLLADVETL